MAKLVFGMNQSLDGYVDHKGFAPGPTLFRHLEAFVRRDGVRRPRAHATQHAHSGGAGAPPGPNMRSCQELTDDRKVHTKRAGTKPR